MKKLLNNNKIRIIISILISVILWATMSFSPNNEMVITVSDIPITIDLPEQAIQDNLQIFGGTDITASVEVTGNRMTIGSLSASDIQIYAQQTNTITTSGKYTLALSARKAGIKTGYEISSPVSPSVITIFVDRYSSLEMNITNELHYQAAEGYYTSVSLSAEKVTIEGPETELNRIDKVTVDGQINGELTETQTMDNIPLTLYDKYGNIIDSDNITLSIPEVSVTLLVLPEKNLPIKLFFPNTPDGMDISEYITSFEPASVLMAGPPQTINGLTFLSATGPDFTTLRNNVLELNLPIEIPSGCRNLSNQTIAKVTLDLSSMSYTDFVVNNFNVVGLLPGYNAEVTTKSITVRVYGPQKQLDELSETTAYGEINLNYQNYSTGSTELPVRIIFSNSKNLCWQYGSYTANVTIYDSDSNSTRQNNMQNTIS